eukprot:Em0007g1166a
METMHAFSTSSWPQIESHLVPAWFPSDDILLSFVPNNRNNGVGKEISTVNSGSGDGYLIGWEKKVHLNGLSDIDEDCVSPKGWAAPRGSAILGQPVGPAKQASLEKFQA